MLASWVPVENAALFVVLGSLSVLLLGAAKSGFGGGIGMLSVPLMIAACGGNAPLATGVTLPILIACDYVSVPFWWRRWDWRNIRMLLPGMVLGVGMGWLVLHTLFTLAGDPFSGKAASERTANWLNLFIGLIAAGFVVLQVLRWTKGDRMQFRPNVWHGLIAGSSAGLVSTLAHTAGPITAMYLLPQKMSKERFAATNVLYYWIGNQIKLVPYFFLGLLNVPSLSGSMVLLPAAVAGAVLGIWLHRRVNERVFSYIVYGLLGGIGVYMVVTATMKLTA